MLERRAVILDVDTGVDDALALALAVRSPACDLVAVTTAAGNVGVDATTENTRRVLAFLGAGDVPVYRGMGRPLARPPRDSSRVHGPGGLGTLALPEATAPTRHPSAPQFLVDAITAHPGAYTLVCVGPQTNLAVALALEPSLPEAMRGLVVMGGALKPGNHTPYAEFNMLADPHAAAQVFAACPLTMVGLDATHGVKFTPAMHAALAHDERVTGRLVHGAMAEGFGRRGWAQFHLHDPLAVGVALDPTFCVERRGTVTVHTADDERVGQTTLRDDPDGPHRVCVGVDAPRFLAWFADTLGLADTLGGAVAAV